MAKRSVLLSASALGAVLVALATRATTLHSVEPEPLIHRVLFKVNDLDQIEGVAPPGRRVEVWTRQRNFKEGEDGTGDPFSWCGWKNDGNAFLVGATLADGIGRWRLDGLRDTGTSIMIFPPAPGEDLCRGGLYTELLTRACDPDGSDCTATQVPTFNWINVRKLTNNTATASGSIAGAETAAIAIADGPDDGPAPTDMVDVDTNRVDTFVPGFTPFQLVSWRCGGNGTLTCPGIAVHDGTTVAIPDPEFPFVLGTLQAHRHGGSIIAAATINREQQLGFAVDVNVKFRGELDIDIGCDAPKAFDFF